MKECVFMVTNLRANPEINLFFSIASLLFLSRVCCRKLYIKKKDLRNAFEKRRLTFFVSRLLFSAQYRCGRGGVKVILKPCGGFDLSSILGPGPLYYVSFSNIISNIISNSILIYILFRYVFLYFEILLYFLCLFIYNKNSGITLWQKDLQQF